MDEYLATGFSNVDLQNDAEVYKHCLGLIDSLPYYQECKQLSYELLELAPGLSVLDVGSGIGDDVFRMAERVMPGGMVVGMDSSTRMIEESRSRIPVCLNAEFMKADARALPFIDAGFSRCRIDRTLQHIQGPGKVIREALRILRPEGLLLVYDNDWGTFSINGIDEETTRIIETLWRDSFTNSRIGRYLEGFFTEAGLEEIHVYPSVSIIDDFVTADRVYNIRQSVERAVEKELISLIRGRQWLADLEELSINKMFHCALTGYTVVGRKLR